MHCIWRIFTDRPSIEILYYPEERDNKGKLIKAGHYVLLRRATLFSQPENEKVYSLGDYVTVRSETNDWFMCVISEINNSSKEVKVRFMWKSGQYFLLSKKMEKWFPKSAIFHRCSIPSINNSMHYSFDAIDNIGICDKHILFYNSVFFQLRVLRFRYRANTKTRSSKFS